MKRIPVIVWFLGGLFMLNGMVTPVDSSPGPWEPYYLEGFTCDGDSLVFTGMAMEEYSNRPDGAGGQHIKYRYIYRGTAVNTNTGSGYVFSAISPIEVVNILYQGGAYEDTFVIRAQVISLDRNLPDLHIRFLIHFTYDSNGNLRSYIESFEEICK